MKPELDEALVRDFPGLYARRGTDMRETAMCWGFECGDGWEPLIRRLSEKLEPIGAVASQVKEKYGGLRFYIEGIDQPTPFLLRLRRIGCHLLRRRWCGSLWCWDWWKPWTLWRICDYPEAWDWIALAEVESTKTCETCGAEGKLRTEGWYTTLCQTHFDEWRLR